MYKKQMILQRIACYLVLGVAALVFIYSLGLVTDLYDNNFNFYAQNLKRPKVAGTEVYYYIQDFNRALTGSGLVLILLALSQFVAQNHARRRYYIANYITVGANTVAALGISVWALINIFSYKAQYVSIDFDALAAEAEKYGFTWYYSTFWFDIAIAVFALLLVATFVNVVNLFLKRSLMKAEQQLIKEGREA
ncbi:MAG: hypothetical protein E7260_05905 [Lachnospiraceae bacterium]|nr:hypothetical protein [Lachnospiraceae bacterium]